MIRRAVIGLAVVASMMGAGATAPARAADSRQPPDLTGQWRLDSRRSDTMRRPEGGGERRGGSGGRGGGGEWGGRGEGGAGEPGRGGRGSAGRSGGGRGGDEGPARGGPRLARLPDVMHVTQTGSIVSFEDSSGAVVQEITTVDAKEDTLVHAPGAQVMRGEWKGGGLEVQRPGPRGAKVTQIITLEDEGKSLVIRTRMESSGSMPARDLKRVYRRTES